MRFIYVFFGMVASGKSTIAQYFARQHDLPYYNTDRVRKELAGLEPTSKHPDGLNMGIYTAEYTRKTYGAMVRHAVDDLRSGCQGVVLDGSYHTFVERDHVRKMAVEMKASCRFVLCVCDESKVKRRLDIRARDPEAVSDGRWEIFQAQKKSFETPDELPAEELIVLNTEDNVDMLFERLEAVLTKNVD